MRIEHVARTACRWVMPVLGIIALTSPRSTQAQTDYFNTDRGHPLHVQDARAIERYALEMQVATLHWARGRSGRDVWSIDPGIAYGLLPRTQLDIGATLIHVPAVNGLKQINTTILHASMLHALNAETLRLPAVALNAEFALPLGTFSSRRAYPAVGALVTRTTSLGRVHLNADLTFADDVATANTTCGPTDPMAPHDVSRWLVGMAFDRALALRSMLLGAELVARQPILLGSPVEWRAGAGMRWQFDPRWSIDAGVARAFGNAREWSMTFGAARSVGLVDFKPLGR